MLQAHPGLKTIMGSQCCQQGCLVRGVIGFPNVLAGDLSTSTALRAAARGGAAALSVPLSKPAGTSNMKREKRALQTDVSDTSKRPRVASREPSPVGDDGAGGARGQGGGGGSGGGSGSVCGGGSGGGGGGGVRDGGEDEVRHKRKVIWNPKLALQARREAEYSDHVDALYCDYYHVSASSDSAKCVAPLSPLLFFSCSFTLSIFLLACLSFSSSSSLSSSSFSSSSAC